MLGIRQLRNVLLYAAAAALGFGAAAWALNLWHADLRVPFVYEGDALLNIMIVKNIVEKGWYLHTDALGAPAGMMLYDFAVGDNLVCVLIKGMSLFTSDPVLLTNLFFLFTFPLVSLTALFTGRQFGLSAAPALLLSFLYTLLPDHFWRCTTHLFYSAYFLLPPAVLVAWWISSRNLLTERWRVWFSLGVSVLLGCDGVYHPFFACFFFALAAVLAWRRHGGRHALAAVGLIAVIFAAVLLNLTPNILYARKFGPAASGRRYSFESEVAALKIAQLLLPVTGHRIPAFARLKADYNATHPLVSGNDWVSLGSIGGAGFLVLTGWVLFIRRAVAPAGPAPPDGFGALIEDLSIFNVAAVLLATIGGFSALFAVLVTPQIRGYCQISPFIAYFSLLTVALGLEWCARRRVSSRAGVTGFCLALATLGFLGLLDQTGGDSRHDWHALKSIFTSDKRFFDKVQSSLPAGAMVFELPYLPFPEYGTMNQMKDYAPFRPYFHTHGLRWSYGVIKGRSGDVWEQNTAAEAPAAMVTTLRGAGFAGIYVDRSGYVDHGVALEGQLRAALGSDPLPDAKGRFLFFKFSPAAGGEAQAAVALSLAPPRWSGGFYDLEASAGGKANWRWCASTGEMHILNDTATSHTVRLAGLLRCGYERLTHLRIEGAGLDESLVITPGGVALSQQITVEPGIATLRFSCDGDPLPKNSNDSRTLVWRIDDFQMEDSGAKVQMAAPVPLPPPQWSGGFHDLESSADGKTNWRWCASSGEMRILNQSATSRAVRLTALLRAGTEKPTHLKIEGNGLDENLVINLAGVALSRQITVGPGTATLRFSCDGDPLPKNSKDSRTLVWRIDDFQMEQLK
jgi:phosphoglycerol transferase